ncbi:hypothetical protein GALMADRAFT_227222 [Galerina marginata CBS 339.88]|uniref:Uncharacterized protein n=1 Tax=Galerina marginata (strain CBS 339.88) TaxID=685588 RepID=A0A067SXS8_GALM3|nr:hypothetical protein GALMADRAFT_227222 [Galerina marginata CBS 339.88]
MPSLPSDPSHRPPILDLAFEAAAANGENNHGDSDSEQNQWLQRESIPGLKEVRYSKIVPFPSSTKSDFVCHKSTIDLFLLCTDLRLQPTVLSLYTHFQPYLGSKCRQCKS